MLAWGLQFAFGLLAANVGEWLLHRYVLHVWGKRPDSFWSYHWHEHHQVAWQRQMLDPGYLSWPQCWNTQAKELLVLALILLLHLPWFWWANGYACAMYASVALYYVLHRRAHLDRDWAKAHLPWHYHHHMHNSDCNWCITHPLCDYLFGTWQRLSP